MSGCTQGSDLPVKLDTPLCISGQSTCHISTDLGEFAILFDHAEIVAETSFNLILRSNESITVSVSGYLEGKDMYMGKVPLIFEQNANEYIARLLLGACSQPTMTWRMWLTFKDENSGKEFTRFVDFVSKRL